MIYELNEFKILRVITCAKVLKGTRKLNNTMLQDYF